MLRDQCDMSRPSISPLYSTPRIPIHTDPPTHDWTNPETNRLVEILSRSSTYQKIFFPPPGQRSDDNEGRYERELCLRILDRTAWMDWMIKSGWVERDDRGRPFGKSFWNESSCPVTHRLRWLDREYLRLRRYLGESRCPEELPKGSSAEVIWRDCLQTGEYTWYFTYLGLKTRHEPLLTYEPVVASLASRQDPSLPRRPRSRSPVRRPFAKGELARATHSGPVRQLDVYRPSSSSGRQRKSPVPLQLLSHHHIAQLDSQRSQSPKPVIDWRHVRPSWSQYCSDQRESSASRSPTVTGDPKRSFSQYSTVQRDSRGSRSPLATAEARSANRRRTDPLNRSPPTPAASPRPQERQGVTVSEAIIFDVADSGSSNASTADVEEDSSLEIERASGSSDGPSRSPSPEPINLPAARDERDEHCARRIVRQSRVHSRLPTPPAATPETNSDPDLPSPISPKPQVTGEHSSGPLKGDIVIETSPSLCFDFPSPSAIKLKLASWISAGSSPSRIADNIESREAISQEISGHNPPNLAAASSDPLEDDLIDFDREADGVVGFLDALAGPCDETAHDLQEEPLPSETSSSTLLQPPRSASREPSTPASPHAMDVKERPIKADEIPQSSLSTLEISDTLLRDPPDLIGKPPTPLSTEGSSDQCKTSARDTDFGMPSRSVLSKPWRRCPAADDPVKPTSDPPTPITSKIDKSYAESSDANNARLPSPTPHMEASSIALASRLGSKSDSTGAPLPLLFRLQPPNVPAATSSLPAEHASLSERMSISKPEDVRTTAPAKALAERLRPGIAASQPMPSILAPVKAPLATRFGALSSLPNRPFGEGPNAAIPILEAGQPGWRNPLASESPELLPLVPLAQRMLPVASNVLGAAAVDAVTGVPALNSALNASRSASDNGHTVEDIVSGTELHNHRHISHSADKRVPGASLRPPFALAQHSISGTARPSIENATNLNADTSGLRFKEASGSIPAHLNVDFGSLPQTPSIPLGSFPLADGGETFLDDQTSATASTTDDDTDRQLHTDADLIPVSSGQILCADPSNELPPRAEMGRTPQNSTQVINPAKEVASLIIRLLLSELSRCSSSCLEGFEVAFAPGSLPLRSDIGHMIEVMGGLLLDIDSKGLQAPARASLQRYIVFPRGPRDIKGDPYDKHVDTIHLDVVEFLELLNGLRDPDTSTPLEFARFAARPSLFERLSKSD